MRTPTSSRDAENAKLAAQTATRRNTSELLFPELSSNLSSANQSFQDSRRQSSAGYTHRAAEEASVAAVRPCTLDNRYLSKQVHVSRSPNWLSPCTQRNQPLAGGRLAAGHICSSQEMKSIFAQTPPCETRQTERTDKPTQIVVL
jgi:hypothetical protein